MGNDYVPETSGKQSQSGGYLSSIVSNITSTIRGDGTDAGYAGHPGASGSFVGGPNTGGGSGGFSNAGGYAGAGAPGGSSSTMSRTSSGGMVGLGNPNFKDAREEKTWLQKASEMATATVSSVYGSSTPTGTSAPITAGTGNGEFTYASNRGPNAIDAMSNSARLRNGLGSNAGAMNSGSPWQQGNQSAADSGPMFTGGIVPELRPGPAGMGRVGHAASDGVYERTMIDALCEPGGLKAVPPEAQLQDFMTKAPTLSPELVGNCLLDVLNSESFQSRIKALIVIASLVQAKECQSHFDWWVEQIESVRALLSDSKAGVRTQAAKTLRALGEDAEIVVSRSSRSVSPKPSRNDFIAGGSSSTKNDSLIDILDIGTDVVASPAQPVVASPPPQVFAPPQPPQPAAPIDMFAGLALSDTPAVAPPVPPPQQPASLGFDFLNDMPPAQSSSAVPTVAHQPSSGFDFFADLTTSTPNQPAGHMAPGPAPSSAGRPSGNAISSVFIEEPAKPDHRNAFQEVMLFYYCYLYLLLTYNMVAVFPVARRSCSSNCCSTTPSCILSTSTSRWYVEWHANWNGEPTLCCTSWRTHLSIGAQHVEPHRTSQSYPYCGLFGYEQQWLFISWWCGGFSGSCPSQCSFRHRRS